MLPSTRTVDEKQGRAVHGTAGTPLLEELLEVASRRRLRLSKELRAEGSKPQIRGIFWRRLSKLKEQSYKNHEAGGHLAW